MPNRFWILMSFGSFIRGCITRIQHSKNPPKDPGNGGWIDPNRPRERRRARSIASSTALSEQLLPTQVRCAGKLQPCWICPAETRTQHQTRDGTLAKYTRTEKVRLHLRIGLENWHTLMLPKAPADQLTNQVKTVDRRLRQRAAGACALAPTPGSTRVHREIPDGRSDLGLTWPMQGPLIRPESP